LEIVKGFGKRRRVNLVNVERFASFDEQDLETLCVACAMEICQN
jgi:hypothetical protein